MNETEDFPRPLKATEKGAVVIETRTGAYFKEGAVATIHIHQQLLRQGKPAIIVRRRGKSRHFADVKIYGPSTIVHTAEPDSCGARVTIKTHAAVSGIGEVKND